MIRFAVYLLSFMLCFLLTSNNILAEGDNKDPSWKEGADPLESKAIYSALHEKIRSGFQWYLNEGFKSGPAFWACPMGEDEECRHDLKFKASFATKTIDLNLDGQYEVLVELYMWGFCGSRGCPTYLLNGVGEEWYVDRWIIMNEFPSRDISISDNMTNGYFDIKIFDGKKTCRFNNYRYQC